MRVMPGAPYPLGAIWMVERRVVGTACDGNRCHPYLQRQNNPT
jgi:hypothetical protein